MMSFSTSSWTATIRALVSDALVDKLLNRLHINGAQRSGLIAVGQSIAVAGIGYCAIAALLRTWAPLNCVLSGSMIPTLYRGDYLIVSKRVRYAVGDIILFDLTPMAAARRAAVGSDDPPTHCTTQRIVHRIIAIHTDDAGNRFAVTKGDNNERSDRVLYPAPFHFLPLNDAAAMACGRVVFRLPFVGFLSVWAGERGVAVRLALVGAALALAYWLEATSVTEQQQQQVAEAVVCAIGGVASTAAA